MAGGARDLALELLGAVESGRAYPGLALDRALERGGLAGADRRLVTELVYGTTRTRNTLDWALGVHLRRPLASLPQAIRNALRLGAYQILYLDRVPASAACNESVELARRYGHRGTAALVNAVLRRLAEEGLPPLPEDRTDSLALAHHHPRWLVERWLDRLGAPGTVALLTANNRVPPTAVRVNRLRSSPEAVLAELGRLGIAARPSELAPEGLLLDEHPPLRGLGPFRRGELQVQDESSMLAAPALAPIPGAVVVDACSAPGGKATHLAELMGDRGEVLAVDVSRGRLRLVEEAARRLGLASVRTMVADARELGRLLPGAADAILVDAPCSGLGTLRRRPDLRWTKQPADIASLARLQRALLDGVAGCLKPGGILLYSTCSAEPEENQEVVESFLEDDGRFGWEDPLERLPEKARQLLAGRDRPEGSRGPGWLQLWPQLDGTDGFFLARMRKERG
ncbi:MAG: 16S rRNA (cytosine(967)-C(5))-methyltransferase RsmB [bacterium]|nr:16S rRNA (cytosine(967)-C(5))-methyltransferase RsmB [bacterium]